MRGYEPTVPLWFCVDCMLTHTNGESGWTEVDRENGVHEPLSAVQDVEITMGLLEGEHGCFDSEEGEERPDECDCETKSFTWSDCDGCNSGLGGERYAFTGWIPVKNGEARWNYEAGAWQYPNA